MNQGSRDHVAGSLGGGLLSLAFIVIACVSEPAAAASEPAVIEAFMTTHCLRCHDATAQEGGFRLDTLSRDFADTGAAGRWGEVRFRITAGEMPPPEEPRPAAAEIAGAVDWITAELARGEAARMARRGPVAHYRLSREEYRHTMEDLLGIHLDVTAPGLLLEDQTWHGWERLGSVLSLSPAHVERYLRAAETAAELAFPASPPATTTKRQAAGDGQRWLLPPGTARHLVTAPVSGLYRIRIQASGLPSFRGRLPRLALWHQGLKRTVAAAHVNAAEAEPTVVEFEVRLPQGNFDVRHENPGTFTLTAPGVHNGVPNTIRDVAGFTTFPQGARLFADDGKPLVPLLLVDSVEVTGPIELEADRAKREPFAPPDEKDDAAVAERLRAFAERAWRRPVPPAEIAPFVGFVAAERDAGQDFRRAYLGGIAAILAAHNFVHLVEGPDEGRPAASAGAAGDRVNNFELSARLSFFLWSSLPDEELFAAARSGALGTPEGLAAQVDRMLADPKSERFLESFPRQWLQLSRVGMFQPDPELYPDWDAGLERSMVLETTGYFREVFRQNQPLGQLLDSDWTMLDPRLAIHYGMPMPDKPTLEPVKLPPESQRGGILTQAATLSLTSDGTRHRPVHRGAWVSEAIFARTPPPPPPNVEPLEPVPSDQPKATIREQLAAHSTNATCASCHAKIDPLGLAFDNFDAIGRWRTHERVEGGTGDDPPVDASGRLPDGRSFAGPAEFKRLLAESPDAFARAFIEQLATYALRRVMTVDDAAALDAIAARSKADGYRLASLVRTLATSDLFKRR
ncbi:MAG: DUF1592 domain-containing protein [Planctomycetota bacterium]|nr:DUF1592 domain-containing protein [Planctomycetota bacterium]